MPRTYVALDLETTGLNPTRDAIIDRPKNLIGQKRACYQAQRQMMVVSRQ